ncbi:MAG: Fe-S cluster assembly ATPase SufC [Actinomycetota bacterium]|nr:Fe-S cluster assembly ATPase SufC [Actinomycetota bacterium]
MRAPALEVRDLQTSIGELEILRGVDLEVHFGEIHALMGPNGSGKSTLCHALSGRAEYRASGSARVSGEEILDRPVDERARLGLFQAFQYPVEVPGVALGELLEEIVAASGGQSGQALREDVDELAERLDMEPFLDRSVNQDLSGGEKKRSEIFQLAVLKPRVAVLDEPDSGLDIDAVREVAGMVESLRGPQIGILLITHYSRILRYLRADRVHVMMQGRIVASGGPELADELEAGGYEALRTKLGLEAAALEESDPGGEPAAG